ncbi:MAG TPA: HAD family phosphatase [Propionicimonas sp.]|jgi:HAD superfamily hydrolase (TIGR01509 family)|uniref:HAD family hydrolase n=1 Tax=Propionicimonas sp. TaxID=1955623 RepID=UPI002F411F69
MAEPCDALGVPRPTAIVFDCDGLLVDTEPCWTVAESAVFAARGLPYGPTEKALFIGKSVPATVELMAGFFGEVGNDDAIRAEVMSTVGDVIGGQAEPMPGALELVRALSGRMPIGVASNSPRVILDIALRRAGLTGAFGAVIAADEVPVPKPAPDLYLAACRLLGASPLASVAFEDTWTGAAAARAAGMLVIGVPSLDPDGFPADLVLETLEDPRLLTWASSL